MGLGFIGFWGLEFWVLGSWGLGSMELWGVGALGLDSWGGGGGGGAVKGGSVESHAHAARVVYRAARDLPMAQLPHLGTYECVGESVVRGLGFRVLEGFRSGLRDNYGYACIFIEGLQGLLPMGRNAEQQGRDKARSRVER